MNIFWVVGYLTGVNLLTFAAYARDKALARRGEWRIPESVLLMLGVLGGWPGGFAAMRVLRHKNRKTAFLLKFWGLVVVEIALLAHPPAMLHSLLNRLF